MSLLITTLLLMLVLFVGEKLIMMDGRGMYWYIVAWIVMNGIIW